MHNTRYMYIIFFLHKEELALLYFPSIFSDESSSLEVSSLDPDDYEDDMKHTLSMIG